MARLAVTLPAFRNRDHRAHLLITAVLTHSFLISGLFNSRLSFRPGACVPRGRANVPSFVANYLRKMNTESWLTTQIVGRTIKSVCFGVGLKSPPHAPTGSQTTKLHFIQNPARSPPSLKINARCVVSSTNTALFIISE